MGRVNVIEHRGKSIVFTDLSEMTVNEEQIAVLKEAQTLICAMPQQSVLSLIDYTKIRYNIPAVEFQKEFSSAVTPYMKASAVVGITGMLQIIYRSIVKLTGRNIRVFDTREEALDWLATQ